MNLRLTFGYLLMIAGTVAGFLALRSYGATLEAPAASVSDLAESGGKHTHTLLHVLVALVAVIITGRVLGRMLVYLGQPAVIGEVLAGIVLGPSLLGRISPELSTALLPPSVAPYLGIVAQFGVILYMFLVGLELDTGLLRQRAHATIAISHASIIVPFLLGGCLALELYPRLSNSSVPFTSFALFLGVAMSITAFPVLARILTDRGLSKSRWGVVALTCAATDDVTAWCLLAFVVGVAQAQVGSALLVSVLALGYIGFMFVALRPLAQRLAVRCEAGVGTDTIALVLVGVLLSALATEAIGIHAIFGAFVLGAVIPHDSKLARVLTRRLKDLVAIVLLPAFFALTGMRTEIGLVAGLEEWLICGLIIAVATVGKFGGTVAAARFTGIGWREAAGLGVLMNTRGLMELIVLNIGLELRVISPTLFAMMVLMALATTAMTAPALSWLARGATPEAPALDPDEEPAPLPARRTGMALSH